MSIKIVTDDVVNSQSEFNRKETTLREKPLNFSKVTNFAKIRVWGNIDLAL